MSDLKRTSNEAPLKEVLDRWLKAYGYEGKMKEIEIIESWPEMMGTAVAHRTKDIYIKTKKRKAKTNMIGYLTIGFPNNPLFSLMMFGLGRLVSRKLLLERSFLTFRI